MPLAETPASMDMTWSMHSSKKMARIEAAVDERDLYRQSGLHYEKLRGDRSGQHSVRLNKQWRLILRPDFDALGNFLWIVELVDYH